MARLVTLPPAPDPAWSGDAPDPATSRAPWRVYNIGNSQPVEVTEVVRLIEAAVGRSAVRELLPMQPGDVPATCADVADLEQAVALYVPEEHRSLALVYGYDARVVSRFYLLETLFVLGYPDRWSDWGSGSGVAAPPRMMERGPCASAASIEEEQP